MKNKKPEMGRVLVMVADDGYIPHAKSVMVNCVRQGEWTDDFCLILPPDADTEYFTSRGIYVLTDPEPGTFRKLALFDHFFNQQFTNERGGAEYKWETVLYLDADVLVQAPLEPLLHEVGWGRILADREMFSLRHAFTYWASKPTVPESPEAPALLKWLWANYDHQWQQYNTGIMVWHPRTMPADARQQLSDMRQKIDPINNHLYKGSDQSVINLVFQNKFERVCSDLFCYWRSAWEETIVVHYCAAYAPWVKKGPEQNAYWSDRFDRPCRDVYLENLAAFEETFPVTI